MHMPQLIIISVPVLLPTICAPIHLLGAASLRSHLLGLLLVVAETLLQECVCVGYIVTRNIHMQDSRG